VWFAGFENFGRGCDQNFLSRIAKFLGQMQQRCGFSARANQRHHLAVAHAEGIL
jgi:hypothetical protein